MFDRLKKLLGKVEESPVAQAVTTQVQNAVETVQNNQVVQQMSTQTQKAVDAVQNVAQGTIDTVTDIKNEVMKDGKIDMNDLVMVKDAAANLAGSVNTMATNMVDRVQQNPVVQQVNNEAQEVRTTVVANAQEMVNDTNTTADLTNYATVATVDNVSHDMNTTIQDIPNEVKDMTNNTVTNVQDIANEMNTTVDLTNYAAVAPIITQNDNMNTIVDLSNGAHSTPIDSQSNDANTIVDLTTHIPGEVKEIPAQVISVNPPITLAM